MSSSPPRPGSVRIRLGLPRETRVCAVLCGCCSHIHLQGLFSCLFCHIKRQARALPESAEATAHRAGGTPKRGINASRAYMHARTGTQRIPLYLQGLGVLACPPCGRQLSWTTRSGRGADDGRGTGAPTVALRPGGAWCAQTTAGCNDAGRSRPPQRRAVRLTRQPEPGAHLAVLGRAVRAGAPALLLAICRAAATPAASACLASSCLCHTSRCRLACRSACCTTLRRVGVRGGSLLSGRSAPISSGWLVAAVDEAVVGMDASRRARNSRSSASHVAVCAPSETASVAARSMRSSREESSDSRP